MRTARAKLKKNNVLASRSRFACNMDDMSTSEFLRFFAVGSVLLMLLLLMEVVPMLQAVVVSAGNAFALPNELLLFCCSGSCPAEKLKFIAVDCGEGCTRRILVIMDEFNLDCGCASVGAAVFSDSCC